MKHFDYFRKLENDPNYVQAQKELKPYFDLGDAILRARIRKGWSQAELARRAGTKQANISRIEDALANPTLKSIQKILNALEIEIHYSPVCACTSTTTITLPSSHRTPIPIYNWPARETVNNSQGTM